MWDVKQIVFLIGLAIITSVFMRVFISQSNHEPFKPSKIQMPSETTKLQVLLIGGSGAVGQELIKVLGNEQRIGNVTLLLRTKLALKNITNNNYQKFTQKLIDFEILYDRDFVTDDGTKYDVCICSLGTTKAKSGIAGFYKVDHDYIMNTAKRARSNGCKHYNLVSSIGANNNSWFTYPKVKGQVEEEIRELKFTRTSIYRPAVLLTSTRKESRPMEALAQTTLYFIDFWRLLSIEASITAEAIVRNSLLVSNNGFEILENKDILALGK